MQVVSRKVVTVAYGEPVHHVMQFDPADPGYLYLMTSHQVCPGLSLTRPQDVLSPSPSLPLHESSCSCQKHRPLPSGLPWPLLGRLIPRPTPRRDRLSFPSLSRPSPGCPSPAELGPRLCLQMARVKVAACAAHTTCGDCVGAADAYCGWCALETR